MADPLLTDLEGRLTAFPPNPVPLDASTLQQAGQSIVDLFTAELATPGLTLAGSASIGFDADGVLVVSGPLSGQTILGLVNPQVTTRFTTGPDPDAPTVTILLIELTVATPPGWSLSASFPNLAQAPAISGLTLDAGAAATFVLCSEDGPADAFGPLLEAGLNVRFSVIADGGGALAGFAPVLSIPAGASLALAGPATVSADRESLAIRGASGAAPPSLSIPRLPVITLGQPQVAITGVAMAPDDGTTPGTTWTDLAGISVYGISQAAAGSSLPMVLDLPLDSGPTALRLASTQPVAFSQMLGLISGLPLLDTVPDPLKSAVTGYLDYWILALAGPANQWTVSAVRLAVTMADGWTLVPGAAALSQLQLGLDAVLAVDGTASTTGWVSGTLTLGGGSTPVGVTVPLPLSSGDTLLYAAPGFQVGGLGDLAQLIGGVDLASQLPDSVAAIGSFTVESLSVSVNLGTLSVTEVTLGVSADAWTVVPGQLVLEQLDIQLAVAAPFSSPQVSGQFAGLLTLGGVPVQVLISRPGPGAAWTLDVDVEAVLLPGIGALTQLAGVDLSDTLPASLLATQLELDILDLTADLSAPALTTFEIEISTAQPWPLAAPYFSLDEASAGVALDWTPGTLVYSGYLSAVLDFGDDVMLLLTAEMRPDKSWLLAGSLDEPVQLGALIQTGLGFTAPDGLANVAVTALSLSYDTADDSYAFAGGASWAPQLPGLQLQVEASVAVARESIAGQPGTFGYSGRIEGDLKSHFGSDSLVMSLAYEFQPPATPPASSTVSYVFTLVFNRLTLTGSYTAAANGDAVVTVGLGGVSFGDIVGYLVQLADPSAPPVLSPPWDVLYKINFNDLSLTVNLTQRTLGVKDAIGMDLGLVNVQTIALTYLNKGGSPTVDIAITGSFLGQSFTDDHPLGWDLLNEDPPATPGAGAALLDLKDLGVGQHLVLAPGAATLPDVLAMLHEIIVSAQGQPEPWKILRFDPQSGWLIGANFTVMETVTLGLVFNDPVMYGVQISLAGDKAGPFAGLVFQILYRKISADVGVYHVALQLPVAMRHLEFGEVSVTLPDVVVDIYTDGGFYLDFGFPYNNDWSVCFGVQVFPFTGAGGFYLGRLTAADAGPSTSLVPQISNGTFGPIIEFGVALSLGVGKDISQGPLSAGMSVTVVGVLTGVVAWFNPANAAQASDEYYRVDGSLAIVGKLYGSVDFKVISVSLSLVASVTASVVIEAYAPIHLGISVDVEVEASIKILFVRIHFSFSLHLDASFTIGSQQATPWVLGAPQAPSGTAPQALSGTAPQALSAAPRALSAAAPSLKAARRMEGAHQLAAKVMPLQSAASAAGLQWVPAMVLAAVEVVDVLLLPVCTVAPDPVSGSDVVTITFTPSMQTTPPAASGGSAGSGGPTAPGQVSPQSFDWLVAALLKWGMTTLIGKTTGPVTAVDLLLIYEDLTASDISQRGFDYTDLAQFLASNMVFALAAPDTSRDTTDELPAAVLPMLPPLIMAPDGQPPVDFSQAPGVDSDYQQYVQSLLDQLVVNYDYDRAADPVAGPSAAAPPRTVLRNGGEPITEALFADWLLMVARSAVQAAMDELNAASDNAYDPAQSLAGLAAALAPPVAYTVRPGDTVAAIAQLFGITAAALTTANGPVIAPGQVLTVPAPAAIADYVTVPGDSLTSIAAAWQVTGSAIQAANPAGTDFGQPGTPVRIPVPAALFDLAAANLGTPLATGTLPVAGVTYLVRAGDSLSGVAAVFGTDAVAVAAANGGQQGVLLANGTAAVQLARADGTGAQYTTAAGDSFTLIAAYVLVRNLGGASQPEAAWYASTIATLNGPLADSPLQVPTVQRTADGPLQQTGTVSYQPKAGDTFGLIGGYFTLTQLYQDSLAATIAELQRLNPSVDPANPAPGTVITLPAVPHVIVPGDTLSGLAARFGLQVADLAGQQANATAAILTPNATVTMPPGLRCPVPAGGTLQSLAATLGLTTDALAGRIGAVTGLFPAGAAVVLPNARQGDVDALITALIGTGQTASMAGMASHFMLHGLRLPVPPDPAADQVQALYLITGQQFPAPASIATGYTIAFTADPGQSWVQPVLIHATQQGETVATIAAQYPGVTVAAILAINPGIDPANPPSAVRVPQPGVDVTLDQATLTAESPATTFDPAIVAGPQRDPLFYAAPVTHSVGPQTPWIAPVPPDLGGSATGGSPSLWRLPATLLAQLAAGQAGGEYLLGQSPKGAQLTSLPAAVPLWSWATLLPVAIRQVAAADGSTLPATYLVLGASQTDRDVLLALWTSMQADGGQLQLFLAYPGGSGGLVSDALSADDRASRVAVLKANLSTVTSSGAQPALAGTIPAYTDAYATLASPVQFLRLLWEASITASGGFYLNYSTSTGASLPPAAFSGGADGQVYLVAIAGDPANLDRTLRRYTTAAVLGYNLDPSKVDVFAYAASGDTTVVPTAPPGNLGFSLSRANPAPDAQPSPQARTQSLFSLLAFGLTGTGIQLPAVTLPDGPDSGADGSWQYRRTVPVAKLVTNPPPDQASGVLPAGASDPYLGIARLDGAGADFAGSSVELSFAFRDVFGNEMPTTPPIGTVSAPVGYYDTVLGLSGWPAAGGHFDITGASGAAVLTARLDLGLDKYVPSPANPFAAAIRTAAAHQVSYRKAFYQLGQEDVTCSVSSSLDEPGAGPLISGRAVKRPLQAFATAAYLYLGAAQSVQQVQHQVSGAETLGGVADSYAVTPAELVTANSAADVSTLTSAAVTIPHDWTVRSSDTLGGIAAVAGIEVTTLLTTNQQVTLNPGCALPTATVTFTTRPANPAAGRVADTFATVAALMNITVAELAVANTANTGILTPGQVSIGGITVPVSAADSLASLITAFAGQGVDTTAAAIAIAYANSGLLATAVPIAIARVPATPGDGTGVRIHPVAQGESLSHVAAAEHGTPSGLAFANAQLTGLLRAGAQVEVKGVTAAVGTDGSLAGLLDALLQAALAAGTEKVIGLADIAAAIAPDDTILTGNAALAVVDYVTQGGDTIASLAQSLTGFSIAQLARLAAPAPKGVYPAGTSLRLGTSSYTALPGDTFALIAAESGVGTDELAAANTALPLTVGVALAVPGAVTLGQNQNGALYVPMDVPPGGTLPTLSALAAASGMALDTLGLANAAMPDLLAPGVLVTYQGTSATTTAQSTLASVAAAVHASDAGALAADPAVSVLPGLVAPGGLVLITAPAAAGRSLDGLAGDLGVQPDDLAMANSAVTGLVTAGRQLTVNGVQVTAAATDTLASLVRRLQLASPAGQPAIGLADLVAAYGTDTALFADGARLLVPAPQVSLAGGVASPYVASTLTPLTASVTIAREPGLVDPLAAGIAAVAADTTPLSPNPGSDGGPDLFAQAFETAYAGRRLKLAVGPQAGYGTKRLWVADFGAAGISAVQLDPAEPRYYALAPVSRQLESGNALVGDYDPASGTLGPTSSKAFGSVDMDAWMRTALEAIDLFLRPATAAPAWALNQAAFTAIVQDKQSIAGSLAGRVEQVLSDPVSGDALAAAREALRQSMLSSLATAYTTDAVVQFPVLVSSPFTPSQTTGPAGATMASLAAGYGLSPAGVAVAFAGVPYVLFTGATISTSSASHQISESDTLTSVAAALGLADVTGLPYNQTLFAASLALDLVPMTRLVAADDTFGTLAAFFGTDPGSVGTAAQDVAGLLTPGTTISSGSLSHQVTATDTLGTVAAALQTTPAAVAARPDLAGEVGLLVAGLPVTCFSPVNPVPPRLAGKPVVTRYSVPDAGDVDSMLALLEVSLQYLAEAVGATAGLVTAGVLVGGSYRVADGDTLTTIGQALSPALDVLTLLTGVRDGSVPVTGGTIFRPGAAIPLSKLTRTPVVADSFQSLAAYFDQAPGDVAVANQDLPGTLAAGTGFTNGQLSYTTTGTDTIGYAASQLGYASAADFADDPAVVARTGIFNVSQAMHALQAMPDLALSTLKVPLINGTQYASFLLSTAADAQHRSLFLELGLAIDETEFEIADVPGAPGYQGSDWLSFPLPLQHSSLGGAVQLDAGGIDVPIALRSYPQLPVVGAQQAQPTWGAPDWPVTTIAEGKQWQLEVGVTHQASAQDEMQLEVSFGTPDNPLGTVPADAPQLLQPLAQFTTAWTAMQHDVAALMALGPGGDPRLANMVSTFAGLVHGLAAALAPSTAAPLAAGAEQTHQFNLDTTLDAAGDHLDSLNVTLLGGPADTVPWPAISVLVDGAPVLLTAEGVVGGQSQRYGYPAGIAAFTPLTHQFVFPGTAVAAGAPGPTPPQGRDAVQWQHGQALMSVTRNALLVADKVTNPLFVYQTPLIGFVNPAVPLLRTAAPIQVGTGPGIADGVQSALSQLLGTDSQISYQVKMLCRYDRQLVVASTPGHPSTIVAPLPVFYVPLAQLRPGDIPVFAENAATQAQAWWQDLNIQPGTGDAYVFDISVYSNDDPQMTRPLIEFSQLTVPLS